MRRLLGGLAGAAVCALALGCGSDDSSDSSGGAALEKGDTYTVGFAAGRTGYIGPFDEPFIRGLKARFDAINAKGGIDGKVKVDLQVRDTRSDAATGVLVGRELLDGGAEFLIVPCDVDAALPAARIAQESEVPTATSCGASSNFPAEVGDYGFMNVVGTRGQGKAMASFALKKGWKTACILGSNEIEYTKDIDEQSEKAFTEGGGKIICKPQFKLDQPRYSAQATEIANANPDVVLTPIFLPGSVTFMKNLRAAGYDGPVVASDSVEGAESFAAGDSTRDLYTVTHGYPSDDKSGKLTQAFYDELGHRPESIVEAEGADLASTISAAVQEAGSTDPKKVRDAFANLENVPGATGYITYKGTSREPRKSVVVLKADPATKKFVFVERLEPETFLDQ